MNMLTNALRSLSLLSCFALFAGVGCAAPVEDAPEAAEGAGDEHTGEASNADIFNPGLPSASPNACKDLGGGHGYCLCGQPDNTCYNVNCHGEPLQCSTRNGLCYCAY